MNRGFCIAFCFVILACAACRRELDPPEAAFYYWKTNFSLDEALRNYLDSMAAMKIYVKFFDVDWDAESDGPVPIAEVEIDTANLRGLKIIPCIFITNRTIVRSSRDGVRDLAGKIAQKVGAYKMAIPACNFDELQIDCDWTSGTRERYFELLRVLKTKLAAEGIELTATIRLHQYKYPDRTGVPPVHRGMLMCYNTGNIGEWSEENSILRIADLKSYLDGSQKYPLPLDLALPVFRWGVLFRDGRMIRLLHGLGTENLSGDARFRYLAENRFEVEKSTFWEGHYLYAGDLIRLENIEEKELEESCRILSKVHQAGTTLAWFHLDTMMIRRFPAKTLKSFWHN